MATDIQEALTAAGAAPLVSKRISPVLLEYQRRYAPLVRVLPSTKSLYSVPFLSRSLSSVTRTSLSNCCDSVFMKVLMV